MADESSVAAGKRFSRDVRLIREDRGRSIEAIHKETRISRSLIESFEEGGLYDHPTFNEVYLRSFVRAYAEAIDISPEEALDGLEAALEGTYERALAERYLESASEEEGDSTSDAETFGDSASAGASGEGGDSDGPSSATPSAGGPEGRGGLVGPPRALGEESSGTTEEAGDEQPSPADDPAAPSASAEARTEELDEEREAASAPLSPSESEASPEAASSAAAPEDEEESAGGETSDDEEEGKEEPETDEPEAEDEPEGRNEADDASGDTPAWMEGRPEEETESSPSPSEEAVSPDPSLAGEQDGGVPEGTADESGIVGDPTAVGGEEGPPEVARTGATTAPDQNARRSGWKQLLRGEQREMLWAGIGIIVILLVLVGLGVAYYSASSQQTRQASTTAAPPDTATTTAEDTSATPSRPPPANVTLGDTIYLTVLATAPVSEIRIQRDDDLERPYWIEQGKAEVFPFQERVTLEQELGDIRLFLAGYPYPHGQQDTTGQIEITRSQVEAFVDTLRGPPASLSVTTDTIPKGPLNP